MTFFGLLLTEAGSTVAHHRPEHPHSVNIEVSNADIQQVMQQLWQLDANRLVTDVDYQLDYQGAASSNSVSDHATNT